MGGTPLRASSTHCPCHGSRANRRTWSAPYPVASIRPWSTHGAGLGSSSTKYRSSAMRAARSSSGVNPSGRSKRRPPSVSNMRLLLERDVPVLAGGDGFPFRGEHPERPDQPGPRLRRFDHVVHETALGGRVRGRELVAVLADQLGALHPRVGGPLDLSLEHDVDGSL